MKSPQQLHKILRQKNSQVASLVTQANYFSRLSRTIQSILPMPLSQHVQVGQYNEHVLTLIVDSPSWASRLRYSVPELRHKLRSNALFPGKVTDISIKVMPVTPSQNLRHHSHRQVDTTSVKALAQTINDEDLKQALLRLATHPKYK